MQTKTTHSEPELFTTLGFVSLAKQVGHYLAIALNAWCLTDKYFQQISFADLVGISQYSAGDKRLTNLLLARLRKLELSFEPLQKFYYDAKTPEFLKPQILQKIEKLPLGIETWLSIYGAHPDKIEDIAFRRALAATKVIAKEAKKPGNEDKKPQAYRDLADFHLKVHGKHPVEAAKTLKSLILFATAFEEYTNIMYEVKEGDLLGKKCIKGINNLQMSFSEWQSKIDKIRGGRWWCELYQLIQQKMKETAQTFDENYHEIQMFFIDKNLLGRKKSTPIKKHLLVIKNQATTFAHYRMVCYAAQELGDKVSEKEAFAKMRVMADTFDDYFRLYLFAPLNSPKRSEALEMMRQKATGIDDWLGIAQIKHLDNKLLKSAEEEIRKYSESSVKWLEIYRDKKSTEAVKEISLGKWAELQESIEFWQYLYYQDTSDDQIRKICLNKIEQFKFGCNRWIKFYKSLPDHHIDFNLNSTLKKIIGAKIKKTAKTFEHWYFVYSVSGSDYIPTINLARQEMSIRAHELKYWLIICQKVKIDSPEYQQAVKSIGQLELDLDGWNAIYKSSKNEEADIYEEKYRNPLAMLALSRMQTICRPSQSMSGVTPVKII